MIHGQPKASAALFNTQNKTKKKDTGMQGEENTQPYKPLAIWRAISSATISRSRRGNSQDASRKRDCCSEPGAVGILPLQHQQGPQHLQHREKQRSGATCQPRSSVGCAPVWEGTLWSSPMPLDRAALIVATQSLGCVADVTAPGLRNTGILAGLLGGTARPGWLGGLGKGRAARGYL